MYYAIYFSASLIDAIIHSYNVNNELCDVYALTALPFFSTSCLHYVIINIITFYFAR